MIRRLLRVMIIMGIVRNRVFGIRLILRRLFKRLLPILGWSRPRFLLEAVLI